MTLSIVIVSYNVAHFLEACLHSLKAALKDIEHEIFVVDNHSADGTQRMVEQLFPEVKLIANKQNLGFSKANNQAIRQSQGKYVLLLNPDTIVKHDTLQHCIQFMEAHPEAGGLGIKMIDGTGMYLPESKRGLPTPWVSFYKIFGLGKLFPKSARFGRYYLSHLSEEKVQEIEILSGAFMFLRKEALDKAGLLDEAFFMYGEDVDLSYRLLLAGYKNYYLPTAEIIHFKGESTKRGSFNYVNQFYKAMAIFAQKHFASPNTFFFNQLIFAGIALRGAISVLRRMIQSILPAAIDFGIIYMLMLYAVDWWEVNFKHEPGMYPEKFTEIILPAYVLVWVTAVNIMGRYARVVTLSTIIKGVFIGTLIISAFTNFFDAYRFSKGLIIIGAAMSSVVFFLTRLIPHYFRTGNLELGENKFQHILVLGTQEAYAQVMKIMKVSGRNAKIFGFVDNGELIGSTQPGYLGSIKDLNQILRNYNITEIIFSLDLPPEIDFIKLMQQLRQFKISYRFTVPGSDYIIGSSSKNNQGDFYTINEIPSLYLHHNLRIKRLADILLTITLLIITPLIFLFKPRVLYLWRNIWRVMNGKLTWVGPAHKQLDILPDPVIVVSDVPSHKPETFRKKMEEIYLWHYHPLMDFKIFFQGLFHLKAPER